VADEPDLKGTDIPTLDTQPSEATQGTAIRIFSALPWLYEIDPKVLPSKRLHNSSQRKALTASGSSGPPQYDISRPGKNGEYAVDKALELRYA
jgi:hypothetical protein